MSRDADPATLRRARENAARDVAFAEGATALAHGDGSLDVVLSTLFFHHLADDEKQTTASELARVLRAGGGSSSATSASPEIC